MSQPLNKNCPICGGYVYLTTAGTEICSNCGYVIPQATYATTSTISAEKYCINCKTKLEQNGAWWHCPNCHYGQMDYIGDLLETKQFNDEEIEMSKHIFEGKLHIPCDNVWGVGKIAPIDPIAKNTLTIERCEKIKMYHKEMDINFEFDTSKLENIDTIIINGYKFVREK